jgi:23S rRNA pseudouridine1911/1915/1917 synthase
MSKKFSFIVDQADNNQRLDKFLAQQFLASNPEITRTKLQSLIDNQKIFIDQNLANSSSQKIKTNQKISGEIIKRKIEHLIAKEIAFKVVYQDDDLMIIDKPKNLTVHPGNGNQENTLVNGLVYQFQNQLSNVAGEFRPGIVHRLDKDTTGLMIIAKNDFSHLKLSQMLKNHEIKRSYLAFIYGVINPAKGTINDRIERSKRNRLKMQVSKNAKRNAITHYQTKEIFADQFISLLECNLQTGRTHQIRVHLESKKHSLVGDQLYNSCKKNPTKNISQSLISLVSSFSRQALHSYKIEFIHPRNQQIIKLEIGLPDDMQELYTALKNEGLDHNLT